MPYDDEKMPFYALGVNLAKQVGGQTGFNSLLETDELELVLTGFSETLRGTATQDSTTVLTTYGQQLNAILQERSNDIVELENAKNLLKEAIVMPLKYPQLFNGLLAERLVEYSELNAIGRRALKSEVFRTNRTPILGSRRSSVTST